MRFQPLMLLHTSTLAPPVTWPPGTTDADATRVVESLFAARRVPSRRSIKCAALASDTSRSCETAS